MSIEPTIRFYGTIKNCHRSYYKPLLHNEALVALEGQEFEETLRPRFRETTVDQHAYYRAGIVKSCCMESEVFGGWTSEEVHDHFAEKFLSYQKIKEIHTPKGAVLVEITVRESTADLGVKRMKEFIDKVLNYLASDHDLHPLSPEDYVNAKYATQVKEKKQ